MTDLQELMACPFCGEHVDLCYSAGTEVYPQSWHVECKCGARMPGAWGSSTWRVVESEDNEAKQKAIAKWNRRSPAFAEMQKALQRVEPILYRKAAAADYAALYPGKVRPVSMMGIDTTEDVDAAASWGGCE